MSSTTPAASGSATTDSRAVGTPPASSPRARRAAERLLASLDDDGRRWRHTQAVAARAVAASGLFSPADADTLQAAAWLHDVGFAPELVRTHFHPVDGAVFVRDELSMGAVAGLVAHHSGARFLAAARGLEALLLPFPLPEYWAGPLADALTWADQTTGPDGRTVTVDERFSEMLLRQGPDSPHARSHPTRGPALVAAVDATEARLRGLRRTTGGQQDRRRPPAPQAADLAPTGPEAANR